MSANLRRNFMLDGIARAGECGLFFVAVIAALPGSLRHLRELCRQVWFVGAMSLFRELGPVVTALLVAGRAGTAVTAEIGLMRATDQLDAMAMMAVDPMAYV